jgi:alkanesulfonate monooxygenase SsuD/methylene tetrahydromethanopterin reductase-like flavin-dependent oxidoreductase (luciferase family)
MNAPLAAQAAPQLGLVLPPCVPAAQLWPAVDRADADGFDSIWVTDRTLAGTPWLDCLTLLGALTGRVTNASLGTAVLVAARRNPVHVAHALATADHLSNGRVIAGIGLGGLNPDEYTIAGIPASEAARRTDETIGLLRRLWSPGSIAHANWNDVDVALAPTPSRPIPVWIGGSSPAARQRAGRLGDGWICNFLSPDAFRDGIADVEAHARAAGRDPSRIARAIYLFAAIGRTRDEATDVLGPAIQALFGAPLEAMSDACLYGTPDDWVARVEQYRQAGAQHVTVLLYSRDLVRDVGLVADHVRAHLTKGRPALAGL